MLGTSTFPTFESAEPLGMLCHMLMGSILTTKSPLLVRRTKGGQQSGPISSEPNATSIIQAEFCQVLNDCMNAVAYQPPIKNADTEFLLSATPGSTCIALTRANQNYLYCVDGNTPGQMSIMSSIKPVSVGQRPCQRETKCMHTSQFYSLPLGITILKLQFEELMAVLAFIEGVEKCPKQCKK